jgi:hypothetical protein
VSEFLVAEHDGEIVGCVSYYPPGGENLLPIRRLHDALAHGVERDPSTCRRPDHSEGWHRSCIDGTLHRASALTTRPGDRSPYDQRDVSGSSDVRTDGIRASSRV